MDVPDRATVKPWGWQIQALSTPTEEVWVAHANGGGGMTSMHRHAKHTTKIHVLSGKIVIVTPDGKDLQSVNSGEVASISAQQRHRLVFLTECRFTETYTREKTAGVNVTDDTIRETV